MRFDSKIQVVLEACRAINDPDNAFWIVPPETGEFLYSKAHEVNAKYVLEIGTSIGYSTIFLAEAVRQITGGNPSKGRVYTMESHAGRAAMARKHFEEAGLDNFITLIEKHAPDNIPFSDSGESLMGKIDILFLDCVKKYYLPCLEKTLPLLHKGSLVMADNVVSHADAMQDFLQFMKKSSQFDSKILRIGTGVLFARAKNLLK